MSIPRNLGNFADNVDANGQVSLTTGVTGTIPVANGGTGQTTYTNGQLLIGNTTGNTLAKATLTQGSGISITNGAGSITIAATGGGTVTSVATGNGLTGGTITTSGTISLDFYTGSDVNNTSYPIGSYLVTTTSSGSLTRNASASLGYSSPGGLAASFFANSGTLISGTWRARGSIDSSSGNLFQRTA